MHKNICNGRNIYAGKDRFDKENGERRISKKNQCAGEKACTVTTSVQKFKYPIMIAFEGFGASGKGIQIAELIRPLDPRGFEVYAVKNESEEEKKYPFLWRFWTKMPEKGRSQFMTAVGTVKS